MEIAGLIIPDDIIEQISLWLPVKPVCKFKCISKGWNCILSSRSFSKNHHQKHSDQQESSNSETTYIMFEFRIPGSSFHQFNSNLFFSLHSFLHEPIVGVFKQDCLGHPKCIVGCCNGIMCVQGTRNNASSELILWNPTTRELNELPKIPEDFGKNVNNSEVSYRYVFSYNKSKDDCEVVSFRSSGWSYGWECIVNIYSMRTGEWRTLENYKSSYDEFVRRAKFVNEKIHWISDDCTITYLDLETEKYGIIKTPTSNFSTYRLANFDVSEGSLYIFLESCDSSSVWRLDEKDSNYVWSLFGNNYGPEGGDDEKSWTELFTIPRGKYCAQHFHVLNNNGEILLTTKRSKKFVIFNMNDCSTTYRELQPNLDMDYILDTTTYIPSLLSPFSRQ